MNESLIAPLTGADRVRKRPAVMFGSDDLGGALNAVGEIIKNSVMEGLQGYGKEIIITLNDDNSVEISDSGRGIPVEYNDEEKMYDWEINFCELYARSRDNHEVKDFQYSLGIYGIGLCTVQYVSEYMDAEILRDGFKYNLHFEKGKNIGGLQKAESKAEQTGTKIKFRLDSEVFKNINISEKTEHFKSFIQGCSLTNELYFTLCYPENNEIRQITYKKGNRCR